MKKRIIFLGMLYAVLTTACEKEPVISPIQLLPELLFEIFKYFPGAELSNCLMVSKEIHSRVFDDRTFWYRMVEYRSLMRSLNYRLRKVERSKLSDIALKNVTVYLKSFHHLEAGEKSDDRYQGYLCKNGNNRGKMPFLVFEPSVSKEKFFNSLHDLHKQEKRFGRIIYFGGRFDQFSCADLEAVWRLYSYTLVQDTVGETILHALVKNHFCTWVRSEQKAQIGLIKAVCERSPFLMNQKNESYGNTPSHLAAVFGLKKVYLIFDANGANPTLENKSGEIASYLKHWHQDFE
jgi:uncharacterized protein YqgQ